MTEAVEAPTPEAVEEAPAPAAGELVRTSEVRALERPPILDALNPRQLQLLRAKAPTLTHAELAQAMELAWAYDLDPYANEVWFAKSKRGRLLIMVGRDGFRKIAHRNGLAFKGAVVHERDEFFVEEVGSPADAKPGEWETHGCRPFTRVTHKRRGLGEGRGPVVGAWCRVWDRATAIERGYFDAERDEYDPGGTDSPWSKQKSAMMLKAVERQAIGQATPLGGLLADGEDALVDGGRGGRDLTEGDPLDQTPFPGEARALVERARRVRHGGFADVATVQMALTGRPDDVAREWLDDANAELDRLEQQGATSAPEEEVPEAEVVPDLPPEEPEAVQEMRRKANALLDEAESAEGEGDEDRAAELRGEAQAVMTEADAAAGASGEQETLL